MMPKLLGVLHSNNSNTNRLPFNASQKQEGCKPTFKGSVVSVLGTYPQRGSAPTPPGSDKTGYRCDAIRHVGEMVDDGRGL